MARLSFKMYDIALSNYKLKIYLYNYILIKHVDNCALLN